MLSHIELIGSNGEIISGTERGIEKKNNLSPKVVRQYTLDGRFLKKWNSPREVAEALKIHIKDIQSAAAGHKSSVGGYKWSYEK